MDPRAFSVWGRFLAAKSYEHNVFRTGVRATELVGESVSPSAERDNEEKRMQNKTKLALVGGIAAVIALAAAGAAEADWDGHHRWGMHGMRPGMRVFAVRMTERYDANKDGKISQEEIDNNRTEWLRRFDTDKDGTLSLKEFEALWLEAHRQQMVREFQFFDKDGDAKVTLDEYKGPLANLVRDHDRNGDGVLSKDDMRMRHKHRPAGNDDGKDKDDQKPSDQQQ